MNIFQLEWCFSKQWCDFCFLLLKMHELENVIILQFIVLTPTLAAPP